MYFASAFSKDYLDDFNKNSLREAWPTKNLVKKFLPDTFFIARHFWQNCDSAFLLHAFSIQQAVFNSSFGFNFKFGF